MPLWGFMTVSGGFKGVLGVFKDFKGIPCGFKWFQGVPGGFRIFQKWFGGFRAFKEYSKGSQGVSNDFKKVSDVLQGILGNCRSVTWCFMWFLGLRKLSEAFHGCSRGLRGLQRHSKRF